MGDSRVKPLFPADELVDTVQPDNEYWLTFLTPLDADNQSGSAVLNLEDSMQDSMDFGAFAYVDDDNHAHPRVEGPVYTAGHSTPSYTARAQPLSPALSPALSTCTANMFDSGTSAAAPTASDKSRFPSGRMRPSGSIEQGSQRTWNGAPLHYSAYSEAQILWGAPTVRHEQQCVAHEPQTQPIGKDVDLDANPAEPSEPSEPCYARLLFKCLEAAPEYTMSLRDIYEWVSENTQKAQDSTSEGWKNSVRHNLSMNQAFQKVERIASSRGSKRSSLWRLTDDALRNGVLATTSFRKKAKRKPDPRSSPAVKRQISGAKGGQATRRAKRHGQRHVALAKQATASASTSQQNSAEQRRQPTGLFSPHSNPFSHTPSPQVGMGISASPYYHSGTVEGNATLIPTRETLYPANPYLPSAAFGYEDELQAYGLQQQDPAFGDAFRGHAGTTMTWGSSSMTFNDDEGLL